MNEPASPRWSGEERAALLASVGGGQHKRPLLPAEVGRLLQREADRGVSHDVLAAALHLDSAAMIGRFIRLHRLPPEVGAAVTWGRSTTSLNLTQAQEVARLLSHEDMHKMAQLTLEFNLSGAEVRGAVQICLRRLVDPEVAVEETVRLRPIIERRWMQLGQVIDEDVVEWLSQATLEERDVLMREVLAQCGLAVIEASLRPRGYTVVFDEDTARRSSPDEVEGRINDELSKLRRERTSAGGAS